MNTLLKIIGISFVSIATVNTLKTVHSDAVPLLICATGILILTLLADHIEQAVTAFSTLSASANLDSDVFSSLLRIVGIGYLTEYSCSLCEDSGCSSLSKKIELAGKLVILVSALPIFTGILTLLEELL